MTPAHPHKSTHVDTTQPQGTALEELLETLGRGNDFPALSHTISQINQIVGDDNSRAEALTEIILRDVSLTNKLLRLVNAAHYVVFGGQPISTISRAVVILGYDAVRDAAASLLLFEHLDNHAQAGELRGEAAESFFCGVLGRLLARSAGVRDSEEAFISALFRNLGRLLARFHFYPQTQRIAERMADEGISEEAAARLELGVDYDQLGVAIAKLWHFPPGILLAMTPLEPGSVRRSPSQNDRLRAAANLAREIYRTHAADLPPERHAQVIAGLAARFGEAVPLNPEALEKLVYKAVESVRHESPIIRVDIGKSPLLKRLAQTREESAPEAAADAALATLEQAVEPAADAASAGDASSILMQGMQDLTSMLLGAYQVSDVFKLVAELYYRSGCFDRVLICIQDKPSQRLLGRIAHGQDSERLKDAIHIPLGFSPDVFHAAISKGQDILIADADADNIRGRIPEWYRRAGGAHAFLLLPVLVDNKPLALLYADRRDSPMHLDANVLGMLKALRNQAILAVRQKL